MKYTVFTRWVSHTGITQKDNRAFDTEPEALAHFTAAVGYYAETGTRRAYVNLWNDSESVMMREATLKGQER